MEVRDIDLVALIGRRVRLARVARNPRTGEEHHGPCPQCQGRDRLVVQSAAGEDGRGLFWCRVCGWGGDAIAYVQWRDSCSYVEACRTLHIELKERRRDTADEQREITPPTLVQPPSLQWREVAMRFVTRAIANLWADERPRAYLHSRGFVDDTIRLFRWGYNPEEYRLKGAALGLDVETVFFPRGIVIPWFIAGDLWKVNFRLPPRAYHDRHGQEMKYLPLTGSANAMYHIDSLVAGEPGVLVEGEFNVAAITQATAGQPRYVGACGLGAGTHGRNIRWLARLHGVAPLLVATDNDPDPHKGERYADYWTQVFQGTARRWKPTLKDTNDMLRQGGDSLVRSWLLAGLAEPVSVAPPPPAAAAAPPLPPPPPPALPDGWRLRRTSGRWLLESPDRRLADWFLSPTDAAEAAWNKERISPHA